MIRSIIPDMDGTLIPGGSPDLDPRVPDIILKLREEGMQFVIANGHPRASVESALEPVRKKILYVANNGAYVGCRGRCLYTYTMDRQLAHRIIRKVRMHSELEIVYADVSGDYPDSKNGALCDWLTNNHKFNVVRIRGVLELEEPCMKISVYKKKGIGTAIRSIYKEFRDQTKTVCAGDVWMDCIARDMNKDRAVRTVQKSLGTKAEETIAFGDQLSGIEMLNQAYCSFTAVDTREEVRRVARFQAGSNVRGGILKILKGPL